MCVYLFVLNFLSLGSSLSNDYHAELAAYIILKSKKVKTMMARIAVQQYQCLFWSNHLHPRGKETQDVFAC